jgi:hypothetical protein
MPNPILVPVVGHRIFGRTWTTRRVPRRTGRFPFIPNEWAMMPSYVLEPTADATHGTRRTIEHVQRLFHEGESPAYTRERSVNRIWRDTGIQFVLMGVVDQAIDADLADLLPSDVRLRPDFSRFDYPGALNIYFMRELEGAWGTGRPSRVIVADRWDLLPGWAPEDAWALDVITLSHELGHALQLSHRAQPDNIMYREGTALTSTGITRAQALYALERACGYRPPWFRRISNMEQLFAADVETPHVMGYAGQRLPTFG